MYVDKWKAFYEHGAKHLLFLYLNKVNKCAAACFNCCILVLYVVDDMRMSIRVRYDLCKKKKIGKMSVWVQLPCLCLSPEPAVSEKASSHCSFSQASCSASVAPNVSSAPSSSTPSSAHSSALLQDPALLRQLLPALQATLHINNSSVDMAKINEGELIRPHTSCASHVWQVIFRWLAD